MIKLSKKLLSIVCIVALVFSFIPALNVTPVLAQDTPEIVTVNNISEEVRVPDIIYHVHVQNDGDQEEIKNGETAGTTSMSKRLEAIWINLSNSPYSGSVIYRTHIQNVG